MIEAMACGTPVVTNDRGSASEIVDDGETGFLCDDTDSLVRALRRVGALNRSRIREVVEQRFSSHRMAADHIALYRRAIAESADCPDTDHRRQGARRKPGLDGVLHNNRSIQTPGSVLVK